MTLEAERQPSVAQAVRDSAGAWRAAADDPDARPALIHRILLVITAFSLFSTLLAASGPTVRWGAVGLALAFGVCAIVAVIVCGFTARSMRWFGRLEWLLLAVAIGALIIWTVANILQYTPYRSDEEIFVQYSADLLRHGHNPYTSDMMPAYALYPSPFPTKLLDGSITHSLDYPALPTLLTLGLTVTVGTFHTVALLCTLALIAAALVVFLLLPRGLRSLAPLLIVGIPVLASGASGGLLFSLVIAPLAFAAYRWQHTGEGGRLSRMDIGKAAAVGIAVSTTQVAWFPIPFLFLGIYLCRRNELGRSAALRVLAKYIGIAAVVFLAINSMFIVWSPTQWLRGVFAPIIQHAVPEGQGLINLIQSLNIGSSNLSLYTYAGALVMLGLLVMYWRHFDRLKSACFALPLIGLLFPARSYWTYFIAYGAAWLVALLSHESDESEELTADERQAERAAAAGTAADTVAAPASWYKRPIAITMAAFLPAGLAFGAALASAQPLTLTIENYVTSAQLGTVQNLTVTATNTTGKTLQPHFMVVNGTGMVSPAWNIVRGPESLAPHAKATYIITAPSFQSLPSVKLGMKVQAVTDTPATISFSPSKQAEPFTTVVTFEQPTAPLLDSYQTVTMTARIQTEYGVPIHKAGVKVCLGRAIFTNIGTTDNAPKITATPMGDESGCGFTDSTGTIRFAVSSASTDGRLMYFQTHATQGGSNGTFGYSDFITAAWRDPR